MVSDSERSSVDSPFADTSSTAMACPAHSSSSSGAVALPPAPVSVVQQINIRSHVPIVLSLKESNYGQWRCCFDSVLGKFGLAPHVFSPPPLDEHDAELILNDHSVVNWLHTTVHTEVFKLIYKPKASAFSVSNAIEGLFRDNEMHRAVLVEAELHSLQQGDRASTTTVASSNTTPTSSAISATPSPSQARCSIFCVG